MKTVEEFIAESHYSGTYNYCDPGEKPTPENGNNNLRGWLEYSCKGIGHGVCDLIPWYFMGNTRGEDKSLEGVFNRINESLK